jgi:hypothetical protein
MNSGVGQARIDQWYCRWDKGEMFQVTALDLESKTIEIQTFDGDILELDADTWSTLPLGFAEPPDEWSAESVERAPLEVLPALGDGAGEGPVRIILLR